jgi:hypothetical protein
MAITPPFRGLSMRFTTPTSFAATRRRAHWAGFWPVSKRAARALVRVVLDKSQPQPVREEAAESLAYSRYEKAIEPLISVLAESDVRIRFWAVFALGGIGQQRTFALEGGGKNDPDPRVVRALESMLPDSETPPGNWWPVGREALAMLGSLEPGYLSKLDHEARRVLSDPNSSPEELRWAEAYKLDD